jgi:Fe-S-cluster containining protein
MIVIQETLVSDEILIEKFHCNLAACKGACCTEGDFGAPVEKDEMDIINGYIDQISKHIPDRSIEKIKKEGAFSYYQNPKIWGTSCHEDGACVFLTVNEIGISVCGIEKTWYEEKILFQKPISCHLYPVRISRNDIIGFEAWNYDRWDICSAACEKGEKEKMPVYAFVKDAIVRKKGQDFYDELEAAARYLKDKSPE